MTTPTPYTIHQNVAFGFLSLIDVDTIRQSVGDDWFNQTLCQVNDCVVRLGVVHGEFQRSPSLVPLVESTGISEPLPLAERRLGRRTVLTFPLLPPPQKN